MNLRRFMKKFWLRFIEYPMKSIKVWYPCNIYHKAFIGFGVSVGMFSEIGNVSIGAGSRIGAMTFIPEGVDIGIKVFIGPKCCFTNDMYPPSDKKEWRKTIVADYARIGAGSVILPGVVIGQGALIGAGSVVTKNVPDGETWAGVPAKRIGKNDG